MLQSPGFSGPEEKKAKNVEKDKSMSSRAKFHSDKRAKPVPDSRSPKPQQTLRLSNLTRSGPNGLTD